MDTSVSAEHTCDWWREIPIALGEGSFSDAGGQHLRWKMKQYVVDAFTDKVFGGNPAAICVTDEWLSDDTMIDIARENHLSTTAFVVREGQHYKLRWITPGGEIDLCGHATLASAYVITEFIDPKTTRVNFQTLSGLLTVERVDDQFEMDVPSYDLKTADVTDEITEALGVRPRETYLGRDLLCILESEEDVRNLNLDLERAKTLDGLLQHVTAPGREYDCVSRSFAPKLSLAEDPVCGSGHCHIIPYWANRLNKDKLIAYQASQRGGVLYCENLGKRVTIGGNAALYSIAEIYIQ